MEIRLSQESVAVLGYAKEEAMRTGSYSISADHLLLGILRHRDNEACSILERSGIDLDELKVSVDSRLFHEHSVPFSDEDKISVSRSAQNAINMAAYEALRCGLSEVMPVHLMIAVTRAGNSVAKEYLAGKGVTSSVLVEKISSTSPDNVKKEEKKKKIKPLIIVTGTSKKQIPS